MRPHEQLEKRFAEWQGLDPGRMVACSSGTAALHLALEALQLPLGSEVIVPEFTMIACARAVTLAGLTPVFVDCGDDLLIDVEQMKRAIGPKTSAVMPVHVYGRQVDITAVANVIRNNPMGSQDIYIVEDLAEAHGVKPSCLSDAACWSFYRNKVVAGEEGGAVYFADDPHSASLARQLRSLGFTDAHDFNHVPRGHNYRMSDAHAKPVIKAVGEWGVNNRERRRLEGMYDTACPHLWKMPPRNVPWVYDVRVPGGDWPFLDEAVKALNGAGVAARHGFKPMSTQLEYADSETVHLGRLYREGRRLPEKALAASKEVLYFPLTPGVVKDGDISRGLSILRETARAFGIGV